MTKAIETIEYSVCEDCIQVIAYGHTDCAEVGHDKCFDRAVERELSGRTGFFSCGTADPPTEEEEASGEVPGYEEFSSQECELCRSSLGGSRHAVTLIIQEPEDGAVAGVLEQ